MADEYKSGEIVKHRLTNENCMVLRKGKEQYLVRTPDYKEVWVYANEIAPVED